MGQTLINGLISASWIALVGVGFGLTFSCCRFFNFVHGIVFTSAAYCAYLFVVLLGVPLCLSLIASISIAIIIGGAPEIVLYRPLRERGGSSLVLLLVSLGLYVVLENIISMLFGKDTKTIRSGSIGEGFDVILGKITSAQISIIFVSVIVLVSLTILLRTTRVGTVFRAVANDPELASISGIPGNRVILLVSVVASTLAAVSGILVALDVDMTPTMGMNAFMLGAVAAIVGGSASVVGVALGALLVGLSQHVGVWKVSSQWQDAIVFLILLICLSLRPQGLLGKKIKKAKA
jgi:branched-subunit amino acid ABC-type transport system permease component